MGSPGFMAPEQRGMRDVTVDARADVYGLGATLYRMCTGRRERRLYRCSEERHLLEDLPDPVAELVEGCCRFAPEDRLQTMTEVRERVARALPEVPSAPRPITGLCDPRGASRTTLTSCAASIDELRRRLEPELAAVGL
jgi:serine/threonine-protein kinase